MHLTGDREPAVTGAQLRDDLFIMSTLIAKSPPHWCRRTARAETSACMRTLRRRLKEANLTQKRPATSPKLTTSRRTSIGATSNGGLSCSLTSAECVCITVIVEVKCIDPRGEQFSMCCFAETVAYDAQWSENWLS